MAGRDIETPTLSTPFIYTSSPSVGYQWSPAASEQENVRSSGTVKKALTVFAVLTSVALLATLLLAAGGRQHQDDGAGPKVELRMPTDKPEAAAVIIPASRGVEHGVSEKSMTQLLGSSHRFTWTRDMLDWQRTAFHFQPEKNWMNDPNGPLYYKGWYHLFYQYNPDSAVWGNIHWGHAVSRDLIHWLYLPLAMVPDQWYDANGVFSGSATLLHSGEIVILYTGSTNTTSQVQCIAVPADPEDPLLLNWVKSEANPVLRPPEGIGLNDFRDPATAWYLPDQEAWFFAIGSKDADHAGLTLVYKTKDFANFEKLPGALHSVANTGMWECIDFYPVSTEETTVGLDTSATLGPNVKHVMKASLDDSKRDYYAIGRYYPEENKWIPDDPEKDVGIGLRYDYGKYYASKTFYDQKNQRRILWGWIGETDSEQADLQKGWASVQAIPRTVTYDTKTESNLLLWPVEEIESLRLSHKDYNATVVAPGSVVPVDMVGKATQLDIEAEFEIDPLALTETIEADVLYNCSTSGGAAGRGMLGPFGLLVLASDDLSEQTAVYFYVARGTNGDLKSFFCQDEQRSSKATDTVKRVYGSTVPVLNGENFTVRVMVDHSIVESFAQKGRSCITSRVYPTNAFGGAAKVFLFNNATAASITAKSLKIYQMENAYLRPFSF